MLPSLASISPTSFYSAISAPMISFKHMYLKALPLFLTGSAALFTNWTDTYVSSFFGAPAVAAVGICGMMFFVLFSFSNGFSIAIQSFTAGFLTSRKNNEVLDAFVVCLVLGVSLALILTTASIYFLEDILMFMNPDAAVRTTARQYLEYLLYATPFYYVCSSARGLLISVGKAWVVSYIGIGTQVVNAIATVVLAFGWAGAPNLGVSGIGFGTFIAFALASVFYVLAALQAITRQKLRVGALSFPLIMEIIGKAVLSASQCTIYALGIFTSYWIVGHLSVLALAVYQVITQATLIPIYAANALGSVAISQVGQAVGAKDQSGAQQVGMKMISGAAYPIVIYALLVMLISEDLLILLLGEALDEPQLIMVFTLSCLILPLNIAGAVANYVLQGAQLFGRVWTVSAVTQWLVFLPLAYVFGVLMNYSLAGVIFADFIYRSSLFFVQYSFWKGYSEPALANP
ncbi:Na+-driven multidrug efflux pump [Pseudovibrio denitrificans]|uniref:Na+-driven multidrug efflux pump n=2 Tax=Pseudovibrio denitrificans TaxID=258256 RepID=A0A1I7B8Y1_9HYPH|nr:MATE family efflux transporter [Pseudovibrio denitrificans]SFT83639.1 Na+-driven multidrug efflux pump [Pseudovibrio denitrificans]